MADKKAKLRTSNKEAAAVEVVKSDEEQRAAYLEKKREVIGLMDKERLNVIKLFSGGIFFLLCMAGSMVFSRHFEAEIASYDNTYFGVYLSFYLVMVLGELFIGYTSYFELVARPLAEALDNAPDVNSALILSVIKEDGFRDPCLVHAKFPFPREAFGVEPMKASVIGNSLILDFTFCELATNRYCTITPCSLNWEDFCWWDEPRRQREIGAVLADAFRAFHVCDQ